MLYLHVGEKLKSQDKIISKIEERYKKDETDEFLKPIVIEGDGRVKGTYIQNCTRLQNIKRLYLTSNRKRHFVLFQLPV